jgi:hypothetical protein
LVAVPWFMRRHQGIRLGMRTIIDGGVFRKIDGV